ncbi:hypothetical protein [Streptomyces sp. NPDC014006]|uniref:hypothetical protein n=1 Tax=Streptomyces sp. NPDC014006 TaxID=3364870 RepID=UPI003701118A
MALRALRAHAERVGQAPSAVRGGAVRQGFVIDAFPWPDGTRPAAPAAQEGGAPPTPRPCFRVT